MTDDTDINLDTDITPNEEAPAADAPKGGAPFYCPGCGRPYGYQTQCTGASAEAPHAPIEVVSTDELTGDPSGHTPAPNTGI